MNDGGPAFPVSGYHEQVAPGSFRGQWPLQGMSLRDYFAAHALQGIMSSSATLQGAIKTAEEENLTVNGTIALAAYQAADAMLAERSKR